MGVGVLTCLSLILGTSPAWAVQTHGSLEGMVVHQIGHLLFVFGMGYLLLRISRAQLKTSGWFEFRIFLYLIILWNLLTFSGHWLNEFIEKSKFIQSDGKTVAFSISSFADTWFYISRLDHFLLVPSFIFLILALRSWRGKK